MKTYLEVRVTATPPQQELLIPTMVELGCGGFEETDSDIRCYFETSGRSEQWISRFRSDLGDLLRTISSNATIDTRVIEEENWNQQWERSLRPIEVGSRLVVKPSWTPYHNVDGRIVLHIDPKMSFGTGYHETTRLMLRLLEEHVTGGASVLDVGTGTGILAIAAVKLGASEAIGIDDDSWALENSLENIKANGVERQVRMTDTPLAALEAGLFDIVCANITLNAIIEMLPAMTGRLKPHGVLLLSGFLTTNHRNLEETLLTKGLSVVGRLSEGDWTAIVARRAA